MLAGNPWTNSNSRQQWEEREVGRKRKEGGRLWGCRDSPRVSRELCLLQFLALKDQKDPEENERDTSVLKLVAASAGSCWSFLPSGGGN